MDPLVTLAVTTLNRPKYLKGTLASVLAQDYENLDILISDNGSRDETPLLTQALAGSDQRVRFRRNAATVPLHEHFTQCVRAAHGEYFVLLHDDDLINPCFVSELVGVATRHPDINVVAPANVIIDEQGAVIGEFAGPDGEAFAGPEFICNWLDGGVLADVTSILARTKIVLHFGGYQGFGGGRNVDNLLFLQCGITSRVGFARRAVFSWRKYPESYGSAATPQQIANSGREFMEHLRSDPPTVYALAAAGESYRRRIVRRVAELTAMEVIAGVNARRDGFRGRSLLMLFWARRDIVFVRVVLREYLRWAFPNLYAGLRRVIRDKLSFRRRESRERS